MVEKAVRKHTLVIEMRGFISFLECLLIDTFFFFFGNWNHSQALNCTWIYGWQKQNCCFIRDESKLHTALSSLEPRAQWSFKMEFTAPLLFANTGWSRDLRCQRGFTLYNLARAVLQGLALERKRIWLWLQILWAIWRLAATRQHKTYKKCKPMGFLSMLSLTSCYQAFCFSSNFSILWVSITAGSWNFLASFPNEGNRRWKSDFGSHIKLVSSCNCFKGPNGWFDGIYLFTYLFFHIMCLIKLTVILAQKNFVQILCDA